MSVPSYHLRSPVSTDSIPVSLFPDCPGFMATPSHHALGNLSVSTPRWAFDDLVDPIPLCSLVGSPSRSISIPILDLDNMGDRLVPRLPSLLDSFLFCLINLSNYDYPRGTFLSPLLSKNNKENIFYFRQFSRRRDNAYRSYYQQED